MTTTTTYVDCEYTADLSTATAAGLLPLSVGVMSGLSREKAKKFVMRSGVVFATGNASNPCTAEINALENTGNRLGWTPWADGRARASIGSEWIGTEKEMKADGTQPEADAVETVKADILNPTLHYGGPGKTVPFRVALIGKTKDHGKPLSRVNVDVYVNVPVEGNSQSAVKGARLKKTVSVGSSVEIATFDVPASWFRGADAIQADVTYALASAPTTMFAVGNKVTMHPQAKPSAPTGMTQWLEAELPYSGIYQGAGKLVIDVFAKTDQPLNNLENVFVQLDGGGGGVRFADEGVEKVNANGIPAWNGGGGEPTKSKDQVVFTVFRSLQGTDPRDANGRELVMRIHLDVPADAKVGSFGVSIEVTSDEDANGDKAISAFSGSIGGGRVPAVIDGRLSSTTSKPSIFIVADEIMSVSPTFDGSARLVNTAVLDGKQIKAGLKVYAATSKGTKQVLSSGSSGLSCSVVDGIGAVSIDGGCSNLRLTSAHKTGGKTTITVNYNAGGGRTFQESQVVTVWYPNLASVQVNAQTGNSSADKPILYKVNGWTDSCGGTAGQRYTSLSFNSIINFAESTSDTCDEYLETACDADGTCKAGWTKTGDDSWWPNACGNDYCKKCGSSSTLPRQFWDAATQYLEWTIEPPTVAKVVQTTAGVPSSSAGRITVEGTAPGDAELVGSLQDGTVVKRVSFEISSKTVSAVALHSFAVRVEDVEAEILSDGVCLSIPPEAPSLKFEKDKVQIFSTVELQCDEDGSFCGYLDANVGNGLLIESLDPSAIIAGGGNVIAVPLMAADAPMSSLVKTTWDPADCMSEVPAKPGVVRSCAALEVALPPADRMTVRVAVPTLTTAKDSAQVAGVKTETDVVVTFHWDADENGKGKRSYVMSGDPRLVVNVENSGGRLTGVNKDGKLTLKSTADAPIGDAIVSISFTHTKLNQNVTVKIVHFSKFIVSAVPDPQSCTVPPQRLTSINLAKISGTNPRTFQRAKVKCEMQLSDDTILDLDKLRTKPQLSGVGNITIANRIATPTEFGSSEVFCDFAYNVTAAEDALRINSLDSVRVKTISTFEVKQGSTLLSGSKALRGEASQATASSCLTVVLSDGRCYGKSTQFCSPFDSSQSYLPGVVEFASDSDAATVDKNTGVVTLIKNGFKDAAITATFADAGLAKSVSFAANLDPRTAGDVDLGAQEGSAIPALTVGQSYNLPVRINTAGLNMAVFNLYITYGDDIEPLLDGKATIGEADSAVQLVAECDQIAVAMFSGALRIYGACSESNKVTNGKAAGDKNQRWNAAGVHFVTVKLKALKAGVPAISGRAEGMTDTRSGSTVGPAIVVGGRPFVAGDFTAGKGRRSAAMTAVSNVEHHLQQRQQARRASLTATGLVPGDADLGSYKELIQGQSGGGRVNGQDLEFMLSQNRNNEACTDPNPKPSFDSDEEGCCYLEDASIKCSATQATGFKKMHADVYLQFAAAAAASVAGTNATGTRTHDYWEQMMDLNYDGKVDVGDARQLLRSLSGQQVQVQQPPSVQGIRGPPIHFTEPSNSTNCQLVGRTSIFLSAGTDLYTVAAGGAGGAGGTCAVKALGSNAACAAAVTATNCSAATASGSDGNAANACVYTASIEDMVAVHAVFADPSADFAEILEEASSDDSDIDVMKGEGAIIKMVRATTTPAKDSNGVVSGIYIIYEFKLHSSISSESLNRLGTTVSVAVAVRPKPSATVPNPLATVDYVPMKVNHKRPTLSSSHLNGWTRKLRSCNKADEVECIFDAAALQADGISFPAGIRNSTNCWVPCDLTRFMEVAPADHRNPPNCVPTFTTTATSTVSSTETSTATSTHTSTGTSSVTTTATSTQSTTATSSATTTPTITATTATTTATSTATTSATTSATSTATTSATSTATTYVVEMAVVAPEDPTFPVWAIILGAVLFLLLVVLAIRQAQGPRMLIFPFAPRVIPPTIAKCIPGKKLKITCETDEVIIYYTLDDSQPNNKSKMFRRSTAPILTSEYTVVKAIAVCEDHAAKPSTMSVRTFNENKMPEPPTLDNGDGDSTASETDIDSDDDNKPKVFEEDNFQFSAGPAFLRAIEPNAGYANMLVTIDISNLRLSEDITKVTLAGIQAKLVSTIPPISMESPGGSIDAPEDDDDFESLFDLDAMTSSKAGERAGFYKSITVKVGDVKETPKTGNVVIHTSHGKKIEGNDDHPVVWQYKRVGITSITPARGYCGSEVTIYGQELIRAGGVNDGGGLSELKEVRLAGVPAKVVGTPSDIMITVIAGDSTPDTSGNVELEFASGNVTASSSNTTWVYNPTGKIKNVSPEGAAAGAEVRITGSDLMCGGKSVSVTLGGVPVQRIVQQTNRSITVVVNDRDPGVCDLVITPDRAGELYAITAKDGFTQLEEAVITDMSPTFGCVGQLVEIQGRNLLGNATDFKSAKLAGFEADYVKGSGNQTGLTICAREAPQGRSGPLVLETTDGAIITSSVDWRFTSSVKLESITPNRGQTNTRAVIRGTNLLGGSKDKIKVTLGGYIVKEIVSQSNEEVVVVAAYSVHGVGDVEILTGSGERGKIISGWEQLKDAKIDDIDPTEGIKGTVVTINGSNMFAGGNDLVEVTLAGIKAEYAAGSGTNDYIQVTARHAPPDTKGPVEITTESGIVVAGPEFVYKPHTYIEHVTPPQGVAGNIVVITGRNMAGGMEHGGEIESITLAGTEVAKILPGLHNETVMVVVGRSTSLGVGDVVIKTDSEQTITLKDGWTNVASGTVTSATPPIGKAGTQVQIKGANLLCGGFEVKEVTLAGVAARLVPGMASEDSITVVAAHAEPGTVGPICITSDSGASVPSKLVWRYGVEPSLLKATPNSGQEGTKVTLSGKNLLGTGKKLKSVTFDGVPVKTIFHEASTSSEVTVVVGAGQPGKGEIVVTADTGESCSLSGGWTLIGNGRIESITPNSGVGGTEVVIKGKQLKSVRGITVNRISLNGVVVEAFEVISDERINALVAPGPPGQGAIVLTADPKTREEMFLSMDRDQDGVLSSQEYQDGVHIETLVSGPNVTWTYLTESVISEVLPDRGQPGTYVVIEGKGLLCNGNQASVKVGGLTAEIESVQDDEIMIMSPDGPANQTVDVIITADNGESVRLDNAFTFEAGGVVKSITPSKGPPGTQIVIRGSQLLGGGDDVDKVVVAGIEAEYDVGSATNTMITAIVGDGPPGLAGRVGLYSDCGAKVESDANTIFAYIAPNSIHSVSPSSGIVADEVTISGLGLLGDGASVAKVTLAGVKATKIVSESDDAITVIVGDGKAGRGDVVVTLSNGEEIVAPSAWKQLALVSTILSISPGAGMTGAKVTIRGKHLLANDNTFATGSVTLNGVPVRKVVGEPTDDEVTVIAGKAKPGVGDVAAQFTNGERSVLQDAWEHLQDGNIEVFTPEGYFEESIQIRGTGLLCGGTFAQLISVKLAGIEVKEIVSASDTELVVLAGPGKFRTTGEITLESLTGVMVHSAKKFLYTFDVNEAARSALNNGISASDGTFTISKALRRTTNAMTKEDFTEKPKDALYFRASNLDFNLSGVSFVGAATEGNANFNQ